jgi:hypothetical protein
VLSLHLYAEVTNDHYRITLPAGQLNTRGNYFYLDPTLLLKISPARTVQLDISEETVKSQMHQALKQLRMKPGSLIVFIF